MPAIDHDLHIHTYLSACCSDKENHRPAAILALANELGLKTIGFADHVWVNPDLTPSSWYAAQDASQISKLREDLATIDTDLRVLVGCEAETIAPGKFGITPEFAEQLDFVQLPCSHFHMTNFVAQPRSEKPRDIAEHCLTFFRSAATSGLATVIPHSFLPLGFLDDIEASIDSIADAEFIDAFALAAEGGVAIEITTGYLNPEPRRASAIRFLTLAKQAGCRFTFGSDAHDLPRMHRLPELVCFIKALGLTEEDILPLVRNH